MKLLDLFCGAGGAGMGYHRVGFEVEGVDINPQKRYPFKFYQSDALEFLQKHGSEYDVIHASPPCQAYSVTKSLHKKEHPDLVGLTRDLLREIGKPYIIENVCNSPLIDPLLLCGSSFGLGVRRHRLFEMTYSILFRPLCRHDKQPFPLDVTGSGGTSKRHRKPKNVLEGRNAMGIDWMTLKELVQAIPPAYTEWIGKQIMEMIENEKLHRV